MTMQQCADMLLQRGVHAAMACDQGGSCTMYHARLGVVNRPSDGGERPVYTHLGLKPRS
jgi:exopolysaccharide biosynthesis protein